MAKNRCVGVHVHIYVEIFKFYIDSDHRWYVFAELPTL